MEYSVTGISLAVKNLIEDTIPFAKIRGEVSGLKRAASGHVYFNLKDNMSVLAVVCWKKVTDNLAFIPEDGMEIICFGKITTYPGNSRYQLVMEQFSLKGEGELAALLEKRKQKLLKEGLFDSSLKKPIPFLPDLIGVITSSSGAVIKDIINRIEERFPTKILLWSVTVQGSQSVNQVVDAIKGFNKLNYALQGNNGQDTLFDDNSGSYTRPDLLIIARGGGSLEDLWTFNEEAVVRAVAESDIPVISAIGHETDFTLTDYAADLRVATPTAAAELAVPVKSELEAMVGNLDKRLETNILKFFDYNTEKIKYLFKMLPDLTGFIEEQKQKILNLDKYFKKSVLGCLDFKRNKYNLVLLNLTEPSDLITSGFAKTESLWESLNYSVKENILFYESKLNLLGRLLDSYNYKNILKRGFALVYGENKVLRSVKEVVKYKSVSVEFHDGKQLLEVKPSEFTIDSEN